MKKRKSFPLLNWIEKIGNKLPDPAFLFVILTLITIVTSGVAAYFDLSVTYQGVNQNTGSVESITATVNNLLSIEGFHHIVTSVLSNFTSFFPLGAVFTIILGVSVLEGTDMLSVLLKRIASKTPSYLITSTVVFLGVMSNVASSTGYIVLVPLGGVLFLASRRHPIAGLAAAYAGVSGGWAANLLISSNDPIYAGISTEAAQIVDPNYIVNSTGNWYFMVVSTFLVVIVGTLITDKIVEPRLPKYFDQSKVNPEETLEEITNNEKKGLINAGIAEVIYIIIIALMVVPEQGILRNPETGAILNSPFMTGIIFFMMLFFLIPGIVYGITTRKIQSSHDITKLMTDGISDISNFLVLIFFAAQFTALFSYTNLGTIISVNGARWLTEIGFTGLPLLIAFIIVATLLDFIMPVDTAKWVIMAPIFVPMFLQLGLSPESTQLAYRIGDSVTNSITPLMPFFPMIIAFFQRYDEDSGIGSVVSTMLPYSVAFLISWIILISTWYLLGLPLGPGAPITL